ncbi:MAG: hypothetical protein U0746_03365 [Gemmataceae bacterium]
MTRAEIESELLSLRNRIAELEAQLHTAPYAEPPPPFYWPYNILAGFSLGIFGAATSLLFNIVGSLLTGKHPLELIRVYLTFPMGADALKDGSSSLMLAIGCCLYLATGMVLGIPFHLVLRRMPASSTFQKKFIVVSALAVALWLVNFYGILSWLQPALFGGRWIVDLVPWWVGLLTHLVFGWTMLLVQPLGIYEPYVAPSPSEAA